MTGTTIAQAIPIAISPILTRIYTPEDFGLFALYISVASLLSVIATGRYELAIMLPRKEDEARHLLFLSLLISFIISLTALLFITLFNQQITMLLGAPEVSNWLYLIPLSVLLTGIYQSLNYWSNRNKAYHRLAKNRVVQSSTTAFGNLSLGFSGMGSGGLISSSILGQGVATLFLSRSISKEVSPFFSKIKKIRLLALLRRYKKFPLFNLPNALIDGVRLSGINILIANLFTVAMLGQFSFAWKMLQLPISLLGKSLSQVFFQKIADTPRGALHHLVQKFLIRSVFLALPLFLGIYFFATDIFTFVFGKDWKVSGEIASILAPWLYFNFLSAPLSNVLIVLNRQEVILMVSIVYMLIPLLLLGLMTQSDLLYILQLISLSMSLLLILYIGLIFTYTLREKHHALR